MKYKVLIMASLMLGGLSFISCNQQGKMQQTEEAVANEEPAKAERWDSIVVKYGEEGKSVIVLHADGTALQGSTKNLEKGELDSGFWKEGSFYRGNQEFGYLQITINKFSLYYGDFTDYDYYISIERDRVWTDNPLINKSAYKAMISKDKDLSQEIVSWEAM